VTIFGRFLRDRARAQVGWSIGVAATVGLVVALYPSIKGQAGLEETFRNLPAGVRAMVGAPDLSIVSAVGYLHTRLFVTLIPVLLVIFAIGLGASAIGGSEGDDTLEWLLAHPVSRARVLGERYAAVAGLTVALGAVAAIATLAFGVAVGVVGPVPPARVIGACAGATCLALLFGTLAFAVGCATGRRAPAVSAATVVAVAGYLIQAFFGFSPGLAWLRPASPWHWYLGRVIVRDGLSIVTLAAPLGASLALVAAGLWRFQIRDLR
jgi:ABC-2 type transport system permease protein